MKIGNIEFYISYEQLSDILIEIKDEFPNIVYDIDSSLQSSLIYPDDKSFVITLAEGGESIFDLNALYYIEPKIWNLKEDINSQLMAYDLYMKNLISKMTKHFKKINISFYENNLFFHRTQVVFLEIC